MGDEPSDTRVTAVILGLLVERVEAIEAQLVQLGENGNVVTLRSDDALIERVVILEKCLADIEAHLKIKRKTTTDGPPKKDWAPPVVLTDDDAPRRFKMPSFRRNRDDDEWGGM